MLTFHDSGDDFSTDTVLRETFFNSDESACLLDGFDNSVSVKRSDRSQVDNLMHIIRTANRTYSIYLALNTFLGEFFSDFQTISNSSGVRNKSDVFA